MFIKHTLAARAKLMRIISENIYNTYKISNIYMQQKIIGRY